MFSVPGGLGLRVGGFKAVEGLGIGGRGRPIYDIHMTWVGPLGLVKGLGFRV